MYCSEIRKKAYMLSPIGRSFTTLSTFAARTHPSQILYSISCAKMTGLFTILGTFQGWDPETVRISGLDTGPIRSSICTPKCQQNLKQDKTCFTHS